MLYLYFLDDFLIILLSVIEFLMAMLILIKCIFLYINPTPYYPLFEIRYMQQLKNLF